MEKFTSLLSRMNASDEAKVTKRPTSMHGWRDVSIVQAGCVEATCAAEVGDESLLKTANIPLVPLQHTKWW